MKRILISLVCCTPLLFSSVAVQSIELVGPDSQSSLSLELYGPVGGRETLWGISEKLKPNNSVSVYQTLIAIYKLNPYAFEDGDVNKIIAHHTIKVPPLDFIKKQSNKEALALINKKPSRVKKSKTSTVKQPKKVAVKNSDVTKTADNKSLTNLLLNEETVSPEMNSKLEEQIHSLKKELADVNEKLVAHNESNQLLKLKIQGLTDQIANLNTQLSTELENQQKTQELSQKYLQQLENIKPAPFSGDGLVNEILRFITSSIIYLLAFMFLPIILLIVIFIFILRRNDKRQLEEQEQELAESSSFNEEGRFDSLLSTDQADELSDSNEPEIISGADSFDNDTTKTAITNENKGELQSNANREESVLTTDVESNDIESTALVDLDSDQASEVEDELDFSDLDELDALDELDINDDGETSNVDAPTDLDAKEIEVLDTTDENDLGEDVVESESAENDLDLSALGLDELSLSDDEIIPDPKNENEELDLTEFDIDSIEFPANEEVPTLEPEIDNATDELDLSELDLDSLDLSVDEEASELEIQPDNTVDELDLAEFELDSLDLSIDDENFEIEAEPDSTTDELDLAEFDLDSLELPETEESIESISEPSSIDNNEGEFDLTNLDLDLLDIPEDLSSESPEIDLTASGQLEYALIDQNDNTVSLAEELSDVAFTENVPLPKVDKLDDDAFIDIETLLEGDETDFTEDAEFDLELGLDEFNVEVHSEDLNEGENEISTQLDLARAYLEIDDKSGAKEILDNLLEKSEGKQKTEIEKLLSKLT